MASASGTSIGAGRTINQIVALGFGAVYLLVGLAGFLVTGSNVAQERGESLLGFDVNILHNLVHLAIGAVLVLASRRLDAARVVNLAIGATYLLLGLLGGLINDSPLDVIGLNTADHFLHLASGLLLLAVGLTTDWPRSGLPERDDSGDATGTTRRGSASSDRPGEATPIGTVDHDGSGSRRLR